MHLQSKKDKAILLRKEGYSYKYIAEQLSVAKSTLSIWLKGTSFAPNDLTLGVMSKGQKIFSETKRSDKLISLNEARKYSETVVRWVIQLELLIQTQE